MCERAGEREGEGGEKRRERVCVCLPFLTDHVDLKLAVVWICDYIQFRAKKDQVQHSKDLHTSIVASFSCLLSWVTLHPYLLGDKVEKRGRGGGEDRERECV